jgi:hypothetical protein
LKALDIHTRAACVFQGVAVLIALQRSNTKITFGGFARAIGLIRGDEGWQPWHRQQVSAILGAIAALRERFNLCSQFVIEEPGSVIIPEATGYSCEKPNPVRLIAGV